MASRTTISLLDDLDGSEAAETVMFGLGGQLYELDLTTEHAAILRGIFGPYIGAARKVAASTLRSTRTERGGWPSTRGRACRSSRMGRRERNSGFPPWPRTPRRSGALQGRPEHTGSRSCSGREGKQAQAENGLVRWATAQSSIRPSICSGVGDRARAAGDQRCPCHRLPAPVTGALPCGVAPRGRDGSVRTAISLGPLDRRPQASIGSRSRMRK